MRAIYQSPKDQETTERESERRDDLFQEKRKNFSERRKNESIHVASYVIQ
jgi:hypothetical protein